MQSNRKGWTIIHQTIASGQVCGRNFYASDLHQELFSNLKKSKTHSMRNLFQSLSSLNTQPHKGENVCAVGKWKLLKNKDFLVEYF